MAPCALVISPSSEGWFLPALLSRAGWRCEVISLSGVYTLSHHVQRVHQVAQVARLADEALRVFEQRGIYDWVIPASDEVLGELCTRSLIDQRFLKLLPITGKEGRIHLFSKLNLSRILSRHCVPTPAWAAVDNLAMAFHQAEVLGYPCFAKRDRSNGGVGTFRCVNAAVLEEIAARLKGETFLLQQELKGKLWGVEALYWHGQLQAFAVSLCLSTISEFGPSLQRCYGQIPAGLDAPLQLIGKALSAHGWANITMVQVHDDGPMQCIEADMRPTVWLAIDEHLGGDFARTIQNLGQQSKGRLSACYSDHNHNDKLITHPQRLVQLGASDQRIQEALKLLSDEAPAFLEELLKQKFSALLPAGTGHFRGSKTNY